MQTLNEIKAMLDAHGLAPRRQLGQNFLIDQNLIRRLVREAGVSEGDLVLEVGPGTGALTEALLESGARVVACELDRGLANLLRARYGRHDRFTLVEGDCLAGKHALNPDVLAALGDEPFRLVANLPYGVATPLMATLLSNHPECRAMFVTIQKEVAERLRAGPGTKEYAELSVLAQSMCEVRRIASLPPQCFWPRPKVTSEMIAITRRAKPATDDPEALAALLRVVFAQRRKQIGSLLPRDLRYPDDIDPSIRAEKLTIEQLVRLAQRYREAHGPG